MKPIGDQRSTVYLSVIPFFDNEMLIHWNVRVSWLSVYKFACYRFQRIKNCILLKNPKHSTVYYIHVALCFTYSWQDNV